MNKKRLLVTGGFGNLGSWIVQDAIEKYDVTVLTKNHRQVQINGKYSVLIADLEDAESLKNALENEIFHYVIHAGSVNDGFIDGYSSLSYLVNGFGTRNLVKALNMDNLEHFIYLSTFQVYGTYSGEITEDTTPKPKNDYGMSHLLAEYFLSMDLGPTIYSIIRLTNSYGCPKDLHSSKWYLVLNDLSKSAFHNKEIKLSGNGKAVRDFIWMGNVTDALLKLLVAEPENEVYNLSQGKSVAMIEVARKVQSAYRDYYKKLLPIVVNENDKSLPDQSLTVLSRKLNKKIIVGKENKFESEAIKIFKFLEESQ